MSGLLVPLALTGCALVLARRMPASVAPAVAVRWLCALTALAALSTVAALVVVASEGLSTLAVLSEWAGFGHVEHPGGHGSGLAAAVAAAVLLLAGGVRGAGYGVRLLRDRRAFAGLDGVEVVPGDGAIAFAVPGRRGGVVVGDRVLGALEPGERRALLAHEGAHLRLHHHRHLRTAELCGAVVPWLAPAAAAVRFGTERWADEAASAELGCRRTVARAIARAALVGSEPVPVSGLAFLGHGAAARVEALVSPVRPGHSRAVVLAGAAAVMAAAVGIAVQVHLLAGLAEHLWS